MRGFSYRYNAHIRRKANVLRFDDGDPNDYHRDDVPVFSEVLDELDRIMGFTLDE